jgi:hypothetical protein
LSVCPVASMMHGNIATKANSALTRVIGTVALAACVAGCYGQPLSSREKGTLIGTGVGAAGGAIVGSAVGTPLAGAAIKPFCRTVNPDSNTKFLKHLSVLILIGIGLIGCFFF